MGQSPPTRGSRDAAAIAGNCYEMLKERPTLDNSLEAASLNVITKEGLDELSIREGRDCTLLMPE
jgi:hypothetical protein